MAQIYYDHNSHPTVKEATNRLQYVSICPRCEAHMINDPTLVTHLRTIHNIESITLYNCQTCCTYYKEIEDFKKHLTTKHPMESGTRPTCQARMTTQDEINTHRSTQTEKTQSNTNITGKGTNKGQQEYRDIDITISHNITNRSEHNQTNFPPLRTIPT